jgi:hypothetical protein
MSAPPFKPDQKSIESMAACFDAIANDGPTPAAPAPAQDNSPGPASDAAPSSGGHDMHARSSASLAGSLVWGLHADFYGGGEKSGIASYHDILGAVALEPDQVRGYLAWGVTILGMASAPGIARSSMEGIFNFKFPDEIRRVVAGLEKFPDSTDATSLIEKLNARLKEIE